VNMDGKILHNVICHFDGLGMQSRHGTQVALNKTKDWYNRGECLDSMVI
jgi:hypothetical protein